MTRASFFAFGLVMTSIMLAATACKADGIKTELSRRDFEKICKNTAISESYGCCLSYAAHYGAFGGVPADNNETCPAGFEDTSGRPAPIKCMQGIKWCVPAGSLEPLPAPSLTMPQTAPTIPPAMPD